ncbi:MAG TPA: hypothetical protein VGB22_07840 [candidate division Zixibacteria bacterium]|jgi:hypothetical protein
MSGRRWLRLCAAPLTLVAVFGLFGCYTVLKHPITAQEGPERSPHPQEYYRQNCVDCHADYNEYPYGYFYGEYPEHYFEYPRWGHYYAYPWWWDHYWYGDSPDESVDGEQGPMAPRRGGMLPPYIHGAPATNTGGLGARGSSSGAGTPPPKGGTETGTAGTVIRDGRVKTRVVVPAESPDGSDSNGTVKQTDQQKAPRRGGGTPR